MTSLRQQILKLREATGASCADIAETLGIGADRRGVVVGHLWRHKRGIPERGSISKTHYPCGCEKTPENTYVLPSTGGKSCLKHKRQRSKERAARLRRNKREAQRALVERYVREAQA